ncbi:hypothetical protein E4T81_01805 [Barnesiella sp. WM24]|uniref:hypothetical protein n=1 Tax=Barnesiella sp. WM24 TaxID=2558278 RepID=UPI00107164D0|nr:hypothetical protein [Barnesiella sp. WM24]TFU95289.1 hypothetical protein E4T81_01805 [Barnesiella sp. WM24]
MELLPSNRRPDNSGALIPTDPRAVAIRQQYGELPDFCNKFGLTAQRHCAKNVEKAIRNGVPVFASIVRTYGEDGVAGLIGIHITDAILRMGEDREVDEYDVDFIAHAICESERFRLLSMASILRFFHLLKCGEFDIYGKVTPRKILEAFRKYAIDQQAKENRIAYEIEKEKKAQADEEARRNAISWEDWATSQGIDPKIGLHGWMAQKFKEAREARIPKKTIAEQFVEWTTRLIQILSFIDDYMKSKNKE